jgi:hypothetical protein
MLLKGMLVSYSDPLLALIPTVIFCQYNPADVTRTFSATTPAGASTAASGGSGSSSARTAPIPAGEEYSMKLEFDATDGLASEGPLTTAFGIAPRLAALEMLMQPVGSSLLGGLVGKLVGGKPKGHAIPVGRPPLTLFAWGPTRITPVHVKSLVIHETAFDSLLNPIHATADIGLTVLRTADLPKDEKVARLAADYYRGAREVKAVLQLPQMLELGG